MPFREIAETIGRHLDLPVVSVAREEAVDHFGRLGHFAPFGMQASSALTRKQLGWEPTHASLIEDLDAGHYFGDPA